MTRPTEAPEIRVSQGALSVFGRVEQSAIKLTVTLSGRAEYLSVVLPEINAKTAHELARALTDAADFIVSAEPAEPTALDLLIADRAEVKS